MQGLNYLPLTGQTTGIRSIAALGSVQADAAPISEYSMMVNKITAANGTKGVRLSKANKGLMIFVYNDTTGTGSLKVYPATGHTINGLSANTAFLVPVGGSVLFVGVSTTAWFTFAATSGAGSGSVGSVTQGTVAASPGGTTSTTMVMMGLNQTITPATTGRIHLAISGDVTQSTTADGAKWQLSFGTGTAPVNGAALTGTQIGSNPTMTFLTGVLTVPFSSQAIATGLTIGTAYWLDLALAAITGGTASVTNMSITAMEVD